VRVRIYLVAARVAELVSTALLLAGCAALPVLSGETERRLEHTEHVLETVSAATSSIPGLGAVSGISAIIAGALATGLNVYRNKTRETDPRVSNAKCPTNGASTNGGEGNGAKA
jgi:hypothetical protein